MATSSLPTGTITFLLTDIEGSTRLWDKEASTMGLAVARHQKIISDVVRTHRGHLPKSQGEGDSLLAVFARASDAAAAALDIQRNMNSESWPTSTPLRVRIALHTGEAELREGDYYGTAVNRSARLRAIAHGGQAILSNAAAELVRDQLPRGASLEDLGTHMLKDLITPERVYQLCHPDLPREFPQLRSLEGLTHNLPIQLTSFIGREDDIAEVRRLLVGTRLLTLTGPGGFGKTRLAIEVGADLIREYEDGIWLVELETLGHTSLVLPAIALELGVREEGGRDPFDSLIDQIRSKQLLIILDNCEHLIEECALVADRLLQACPSVKILATSRGSLGVPGETSWVVPPLSLPDSAESYSLESLAEYESVRLFVDRALLAKPDFTLSQQDASMLADLCRRLDGAPLAIELASSWVRVLPLREINHRIKDRLRLPSAGTRTAAARKQTIRASIDWSYDLLADDERTLFSRLSVFHGGFILEAAEGICTQDVSDHDALDTLSRLVDKALVLAEERNGQIRYRMLEVVRQYAAEKLADSGQEQGLRARHLGWFLHMAEESESHLEGRDQRLWYERLENEHDNFRAALEWSSVAGASESGLRLAGALWQFWFVRGYLSEGRRRLERALAECIKAPPLTRAKALEGAAGLAHAQGDHAVALPRYEEALSIQRDSGDLRSVGRTLSAMGNLALLKGDAEAAEPLLEESLAILRKLDDKRGLLTTLVNLGQAIQTKGDFEKARPLLDEALFLARELGTNRGIVGSLIYLGFIDSDQGHYADARSRFEEALALARDLSDKSRIAHCLVWLGHIALQQGAFEEARKRTEEGISIAREIQERHPLPWGLISLGRLDEREGDHAAARDLYNQARHVSEALGHERAAALALVHSGDLERALGRYDDSYYLLEKAHELARESGSPNATASALRALGDLSRARGEQDHAVSMYRDAIELNRKRPDPPELAGLLERLAEVAGNEQNHRRAARLLGAAGGMRESMGCPIAPSERSLYENTWDLVSIELPPESLDEARREGASMTFEQAIREALE